MTAAGFYHCSVKPVGRANGRSIVAAAAYRSGQRLEDERTGETFDYRARGGVEDTFIITADNVPAWARDRARLWNEAERAEPRANGRLASEFELALPHELNAEQRRALVVEFVGGIVDRYGVAADVAIHAPGKGGDHRNHHAHVLITHRELGPEGFGDIANTRTVTRKRKGREVQEQVAGIAATPADIKAIRKAWEQDVNRAYEQAGLDVRVDHRSHKDRGIEQEPSQHLGPGATGMERRGEASDRGDINRRIEADNAALRERAQNEITLLKAEAERRATEQLERMERAAAERATEPTAPVWDREADNAAWEARLADVGQEAAAAAAEARQQEKHGRGVEKDRPSAEGRYAPLETLEPVPEAKPEPELSATAGQIRLAWTLSRTAGELEEGLAAHGIGLARVSADEAYASERHVALAKAAGNFAPTWREGEIVAVDGFGHVHRLNERTTGEKEAGSGGRFVIDSAALMDVAATQEAMRAASLEAWKADRRAEREEARPATGIEAAIADALTSTMTGTDFAAELDEQGLTIARVTATDERALAALRLADIEAGTTGELASGRRFAEVLPGDLAAVTRQGDVFRLSPQKLDFEEIEQRLADVQTRLPSVIEARALNEQDHERVSGQRAKDDAAFIADRLEQADAFAGKQELRQATRAAETTVEETFEAPETVVRAAVGPALNLAGRAAKIFAALYDAAFGWATAEPKQTAQQMRDEIKAATSEESLQADTYAAHVQAKDAEHDDRMEAQKKAQREQDLSLSARFGTPPTREANIGRERDGDDYGRERER
ncbi:MAG: MobQ family relaxase [Rhizobiaceae bacterium]